MKLIKFALFSAFSIISHQAIASGNIALTVSYGIPSTSGPQVHELQIGKKEIYEIAKSSLEAKGWKIVESPKDALGGVEARINVNAIQNVGGGGSVFGFAVSLGMNGVSNGTSAVSDTKRVAFSYWSILVSCGGEYNFTKQCMRNGITNGVTQWVAETF